MGWIMVSETRFSWETPRERPRARYEIRKSIRIKKLVPRPEMLEGNARCSLRQERTYWAAGQGAQGGGRASCGTTEENTGGIRKKYGKIQKNRGK